MNWTQEEINGVIKLVKEKSMTDRDFRVKLLKDPATAIKELTGKELPAGLKLQLVEQDPTADLALVLPPVLTDKLTEEELDKVSAAKCWSNCHKVSDCNDFVRPQGFPHHN